MEKRKSPQSLCRRRRRWRRGDGPHSCLTLPFWLLWCCFWFRGGRGGRESVETQRRSPVSSTAHSDTALITTFPPFLLCSQQKKIVTFTFPLYICEKLLKQPWVSGLIWSQEQDQTMSVFPWKLWPEREEMFIVNNEARLLEGMLRGHFKVTFTGYWKNLGTNPEVILDSHVWKQTDKSSIVLLHFKREFIISGRSSLCSCLLSSNGKQKYIFSVITVLVRPGWLMFFFES